MIAEWMLLHVILLQIVLKQNKTRPSDGDLSTVSFVSYSNVFNVIVTFD